MKVIVPRAQRVALQIPITYRVAGDDAWVETRVVNISDSGVLFGAVLEPGTPVEVIFKSPIQVGTLAPGKIVCQGEVVRVTEIGAAAARFDDCRFVLEIREQ